MLIRTLSITILLLSCATVHLADEPVRKEPSPIVGNWLGVLKAQGLELRLGFALVEKEGKLQGTMDSLDQGAKGIPLSSVEFQEGKLKLQITKLKLGYTGKLSEDRQSIVGEFTQGDFKANMDLKRVKSIDHPRRPQLPKAPFPYQMEEVTFENSSAKIRLAGTLTYPQGDGPFPAAILISGSGPQDRDEEILGHRPFMVIADHLTRLGYAVLRYDDRGVGKSQGKFDGATSADFKTDALAALNYLKTRREIQPKRIGYIGHSEGGLIAPMIAAENPDVAFIVMLAGPGLPGDEVLVGQLIAVLKAQGAKPEAIAFASERQKQLLALAKRGAEEKEYKQLEKKMAKDAGPEEKKLLEDESGKKSAIQQLTDPWMKYFLNYDPRPNLSKVRCPVLALNGAKDVQVLPKENLAAIREAMKSNPDVTTMELPDLNHLFQTSTTGGVQEYGKIEETFSPAALKAISDWLLKRK